MVAQKVMFLPQNRGKLWMRLEVPVRTLPGKNNVRNVEKRKLDRWF
jgi:hypothetical protein